MNMKMSLAQALRKRAELIAKVATLQQRILEATTYVEGRESYTQSEFNAMVDDLIAVRSALSRLKIAIDKGNHIEQNGKSVYECIVARGDVNASLQFAQQMRNMANGALGRQYGYDENENAPKMKSRATVKELDVAVDGLQKQLRDLDNEISDKNGSIQIEVNI
jgi:phage shock protein A